MRNRIVKQLLMCCMGISLIVGTPVVGWASETETTEETTGEESEDTGETLSESDEDVYQKAYEYASEKYDYSEAAKLLRTIEDYKDSKELADRYEQMETNRFIDGRFYWRPEEYVQLLKQNLQDLNDPYTNISITGGTTTPDEGTTDTITIEYDDDTIEVILYNIAFDSNGGAESFEKVEVKGEKGNLLAYPAVVAISTARADTTVDTASSIVSQMLELDPHGEFSQDGLTYVFNNDGKIISFLIEPEIQNDSNLQDSTVVQENTTTTPEPTTIPESTKAPVEYKDATTIRIVQQALNEAGYNCGNPDGVAGSGTASAITQYQTDKGLTVNGLVTDELVQSLGVVEKVQEAVEFEQSKAEYRTDITYDQMARTPDTYITEKIQISGKVLQAETSDNLCYARVAINSDYDTVVFVTYDKDLLGYRLLEDDQIRVYGTSYGVYSYEAVNGATITIPWLMADMIEM